MNVIENELKRIYTFDQPRFDTDSTSDFSDTEKAVWNELPEEIKTIATFLGYEDAFPHDRCGMLYGPWAIVEWNSLDGTFGQLRQYDGYPYMHVIKFGDDTYLDVKGEVGNPGEVFNAIGSNLDGADKVADSLLAFLQSAGSYRG